MTKTIIILFLSICTISCKTTDVNHTTVSNNVRIDLLHIKNLSNIITETSGLEVYKDQLITHNDSGDSPTLYFLNNEGDILNKKTYNNMTHIDWEDITKDDKFLYIADIGNNYGNRKDLVVYKIKLSNLDNENAEVEKLAIKYPSQKSFNKGDQDHPFDAESLVAINNDLYIFSKDWKDQTTIVYKIDKNEPLQTAQYITSNNVKGLITGATFNGTNRVVLCGYNSNLQPFIVPVNVDNEIFSFESKINLPITSGAQVEAITYLENRQEREVYMITCEAINIKLGENEANAAAQLYEIKL